MEQDNYENEQVEKDPYALERVNVLQSYILTTARYDFNVYEKRILYRIVE